jgi:hypothetical protein
MSQVLDGLLRFAPVRNNDSANMKFPDYFVDLTKVARSIPPHPERMVVLGPDMGPSVRQYCPIPAVLPL